MRDTLVGQIPSAIRTLREGAGLSLASLAERGDGLSPSWISDIERGAVGWTASTLDKILAAGGWTMRDLVDAMPNGRRRKKR